MRIPDSRTERPDESWTLSNLLLKRGLEQADFPFVFDVSGPSYTYGEILDRSLRLAAAMRATDVRQGDRVISMIQNSADSVIIMGACALLSAVHVPINVAYVGYLLEHAMNVVDPKLVFVQDEFVGRFDEIDLPPGCVLAVRARDEGAAGSTGQQLNFRSMFDSDPMEIDSITRVGWEDVSTLLFTSGTTGVSKAVIIPWLHLFYSSVGIWQGQELDSSTRIYSPWPINHITGAGAVYLSVLLGGSLVVRDRWSTSEFVADINQFQCTLTTLMAEMVGYIESMPGIEDTSLTHTYATPVNEQLFERMGIRYCINYNCTETNSPIGSVGYTPLPAGCSGRLRAGVDIRLVDEDGNDVPTGTYGELILRTRDRFAMNIGYWGMPEATSDVWRDGWFRTGDLVRVDGSGFFYVAGRLNDRIRVRGENVSPDELEAVVKGSPSVRTATAVGVPINGGEDDIHLFVVPSAGGFDEPAIREFCEAKLPKFMWPTHVVEVSELPTTPTGKIQRAVLRDQLLAEAAAVAPEAPL